MKSAARWAVVLSGIVACRRDATPARDTTNAATSSVSTSSPSAPPDCPPTGHWTACQLRKRLDQAGLAPHDTSALGDLPSIGVKPGTIKLGNATLAYYLFADTTARRRAAATLDTARFIPQSRALTMRNEATVIQNDNALAILMSRNEHQRERVADAITAGPPQP